MPSTLKDKAVALARDALSVSYHLFKVMIPVLIAVKVLKELGLIRYLAIPLEPAMTWVGLPAQMGLVWATALLNNIYSAMVVLLTLVEDTPLTTAQATVLGTMILVAHNLPVELKIAQNSGPRLLFQGVTRVGAALLIGWVLHRVYSGLDLYQEPVRILMSPEAGVRPGGETITAWAVSQAKNLASIFGIIVVLLLLMRAMERLRVTQLMDRLLRPLLRLMGIGPKASTIAIIGVTLGIAYGGGLIIREARSGRIDKRDVFYALTLMGLVHSLFEDTLLMVMMGGHLSGLLWARSAMAVTAVFLLVRLTARLPAAFCDRWLWGDPR